MFKFNNKISLKSRVLLGIFLIIYLSFIVNEYQSSIEIGDRAKCGGKPCEYSYSIGFDEFTSKNDVVRVQQETMVLFILPILIFIIRSRTIAYFLTLLTIYLPIYINKFYVIFFAFYFLLPSIIILYITWIWEFKKINKKAII